MSHRLVILLHASYAVDKIQEIPIEEIALSDTLELRMEPDSSDQLLSLAISVRKQGLLQPIIVRRIQANRLKFNIPDTDARARRARYEIVCGHRRYLACKKLELSFIPALVIDLDDREALEVALIENLQRENLNPVEEAEAFKKYVTNFGRGSITTLAARIGKSEEYVSHRLLLLGLPKEIIEKISRRLLKPAQASELIWLADRKKQIELADHILSDNLNFRQTRAVVSLLKEKKISTTEAVTTVVSFSSEPLSAVGDARFALASGNPDDYSEPWQSYSNKTRKEPENLQITKRAVLMIRTCLAGLDTLIEKTGDENLREFFLNERLEIHRSLDRIISTQVSFLKEFRKKEPA